MQILERRLPAFSFLSYRVIFHIYDNNAKKKGEKDNDHGRNTLSLPTMAKTTLGLRKARVHMQPAPSPRFWLWQQKMVIIKDCRLRRRTAAGE